MNKRLSISIVFLSLLMPSLFGQLTDEDYQKALWMTTRFYGGQRSTDIDKEELQHNWLIQDYLPDGVSSDKEGISFAQDSDNGHDLTGGWFDCGDHVFFGQTGFYAGYALLKAYDAFPEGFDDFYGEAYDGYRNSGDYSWEGGEGSPNGIPDVLDEVKHQTDFFIKCAKSSTEFYYEKGDGNSDHAERVTSVKMQTNSVNTGGEPRTSAKNPNGGSMASMCGGALALMSRMYRPFDEEYADLCLVHAKYAYDYAKDHPGSVGAASGSFYGGNDNWMNGFGIMVAELYMAESNTTQKSAYYTEMTGLSTGSGNDGDVHPNAGYTFDYSNTGELALYTMAEAGHPTALGHFNTRITNSFIDGSNYNNEGIYNNGGSWGKLRYVGNAAFLVALYNKINDLELDDRVYGNIDYIMGDNSGNQSYIGGFSPSGISNVDYPTQIHHRNVYLYEGNDNSANVDYPTKNIQNGALVGGALDGTYNNTWDDYVNTEVCVDYNVGLVGGLAAINEVKNPVDTNKFLIPCSSPDLGDDQTLCGVGTITLTTQLSQESFRTFEWFLDGESQGSSSTTNTFDITQGGVWTVVVDSSGECTRTASVTITDELSAVDLGDDLDLCVPASTTLEAGISGDGLSYQWSLDGDVISTETESSIDVSTAGTYSLEISASGCSSVSDEVVITSSLPLVEGGRFCLSTNTTATLQVLNPTGTYEWFTTETDGTSFDTGDFIEVSPGSTTTYYVEDVSSFETNVPPYSMTETESNNRVSADRAPMQFTAYQDFTLASVDVIQVNYGGDGNATWTVEIKADNNGQPGSTVYTSETYSAERVDGETLTIPVNITIEGSEAGTVLWLSISSSTAIYAPDEFNYDTPYEVTLSGDPVIEINGARKDGDNNTTWGIAFNWSISAGQACDRVAVTATEDCQVSIDGQLESEIVTLFPNPSTGSATIQTNDNIEASVMVLDINGQLVDQFELTDEINYGNDLSAGIYFIEIVNGSEKQTIKFVKQ